MNLISINTVKRRFTSGLANYYQHFPRHPRRAFSVVSAFIWPSFHQTLAPQSAQLCPEQALLVQSGALQERLCPQKRSRPPKSSRGTLQESLPTVFTPDLSERASPPGEHRSSSRSPYAAVRTWRMARPCVPSSAPQTRALRTAPRS